MTLHENSLFISKIKRSPEKLNIFSIMILNRSGICIYCLNLNESYQIRQEQLISSYFSALMTFSQELIGSKIRTVKMGGNVKLVIFEKHTLYYTLLCDSGEHVLFLKDLIKQLHQKFMHYVWHKKIRIDLECVNDIKLDKIFIDCINENYSTDYDLKKEGQIKQLLDEFKQVDDISGIIFLTNHWKVIFSSIEKINLKKFLKEIEFRVKICNNAILKLFYTSKDNELIYSEFVDDKYVLILIFDSEIKFGIAELYLRKIVQSIIKVLKS
jgi:hypothetical protein